MRKAFVYELAGWYLQPFCNARHRLLCYVSYGVFPSGQWVLHPIPKSVACQ